MKITRKQLKQIIKEELSRALHEVDDSSLSPVFTPEIGGEGPHLDPRYAQSDLKKKDRHNRDVYDRSRNHVLTYGRVFSECGTPGIVLPNPKFDKDVSDLWNYIIDERGNRSLFAISIDELLGISDLGVMGAKQAAIMATKTAGKVLRKFVVPFVGWAETGSDIKAIADEWLDDVASGFCDVMTMMNGAYWGPKFESEYTGEKDKHFARRHIKLSEWRMYPAYLALIVHYGRENNWSPKKTADVMVSAGWLHQNEANELRNEILKADLLKIKFAEQTDALEKSLKPEDAPDDLKV
jgi:hypothetical protein